MTYELYAHQKQALAWGSHRNSFPCFMEMRTGKSLVSVWWSRQWTDKVILVAPLSTWYDWEALFRKLRINYAMLSGTTIEKRKRLLSYGCEAQWVIINPRLS